MDYTSSKYVVDANQLDEEKDESEIEYEPEVQLDLNQIENLDVCKMNDRETIN